MIQPKMLRKGNECSADPEPLGRGALARVERTGAAL